MTGEAAMRDYSNDEELLKLKESVEKLTGATAKRFVVLCRALYYISDIDDNSRIRLYGPKGLLRKQALERCHQKLGHLRIEKTYELDKIITGLKFTSM